MNSLNIQFQIDENDNLGDTICEDCAQDLINAYNFKRRCIQTQECLVEILKSFIEPDITEHKPEVLEPEQSNVIDSNHETKSTIEKPVLLQCKECDERFINIQLLSEHIDGNHRFRCTHCYHMFETKTDLDSHRCKRYNCRGCLDTFDSEVERSIHENDIHKNEEHFDCDLCFGRYGTKTDFIEHNQNHIASAIYFNFEKDGFGYSCYACDDKNFEDDVELSVHLNNHKHFVCNYCKEVFVDVNNLRSHIANHGIDSYMCQRCSLTFNTKEGIINHLTDHKYFVKKSNYACPVCSEGFPIHSELKEHIKTHLKEITVCEECNESFESIIELRKHCNSAHMNGCLCPQCGKTFADATTVSKHVKQEHNTDRKHECNICHKKFKIRTTLMQHKRTHEAYKPFGCSFCSHRSHTRKDIVMHERIHTNERPYKCTIEGCNQAFRTTSHRKQHIRIHTGEKPHECYLCLRRFREKSLLVTHLMVHKDIRNHMCEICGRSFRQYNDMKQHLSKAHFKEFKKQDGQV